MIHPFDERFKDLNEEAEELGLKPLSKKLKNTIIEIDKFAVINNCPPPGLFLEDNGNVTIVYQDRDTHRRMSVEIKTKENLYKLILVDSTDGYMPFPLPAEPSQPKAVELPEGRRTRVAGKSAQQASQLEGCFEWVTSDIELVTLKPYVKEEFEN